MHVKLKIKAKYLNLIRNGTKKHEYRLATHDEIHIGDILILVSNENENDFVKVLVEKIDHKNTWEEAISAFWNQDFKNLCQSKEDALKECRRFYKNEQVSKFGIDIFTIQLSKVELKQARYLFDTNAIIERESNNNVIIDVPLTFKAIDDLSGKKFYHPLTKEELSKYKGHQNNKPMLDKLNSYNELSPSVKQTKEFHDICAKFPSDENSKIDNQILLQIYNGKADILITSDKLILQKATLLHIQDRVFTPNGFLQIFQKENPDLIDFNSLSITKQKIGSLEINDSFFDTLREDYGGIKFNDWLKRKSEESAYTFIEDKALKGFLYLKTEGKDQKYDYFDPPFFPAKRLKIGTFKIAKSGLRLGERFLKIVFDNAQKRNVDEIFVTMFEDKREEVKKLEQLMFEWGFVKQAKNKETGEVVLVKNMKRYDYSKTPKQNYPLTKEKPTYSFLPIKMQYHTKLFPDLHLNNEDITIYDKEACQYAIEKIYVSYRNPTNISPGDILAIYRMDDYLKKYRSTVTGIAVLNEIISPKSCKDFIAQCKNKSVFNEQELKDFYENKNYKYLIKVLYLKPFDRKPNYQTLKDQGIIDENGPRLGSIITSNSFEKLKRLGGL